MTPAFIVHAGTIYPVIALAKMNGIPSVVIRSADAVMTIPLAVVEAADKPARSRPRLCCINGERV